ncbi:putative chromosome-partitioning protein ParB [Pirellulimonas nuda]|uniref:Putative chromosome-partitioning protein ParB n=1 Tax=Pirellulimonas nuda TaxID=2528009 RepID=A0A518DIB4_9BACT|nr:ParB/RepB/Spo0J family partition protein [Pirellulimonas nuda]QDU91132.1 putative chromosome-partitioning protein ParB [Pirellulimonas nuda]
MTNQRRLGRGLEALLGRSLDEPAPQPVMEAAPAEGAAPLPEFVSRDEAGQLWLDLGVIQPNPFQPRKHFDEVEIADLADSIREHGVLQPLVVRPMEEGGYQLIAGERRLRAAQAAGWRQAPVQLKNVSDQQMAELAIVENVQRKDLNAIEKATSFHNYLQQYGCTQEDLAKRIHIDRSTIANLIRLLDLPEGVRQMVVEGDLTQGHARALLSLGEEEEQTKFAKRIKQEGLSVRATEQAVQNQVHALDDDLLRLVTAEQFEEGGDAPAPKAPATRGEQLAALEQELHNALGTKVALQQNAKGKGRITIHFASVEEFDRIRAILVPQQQTSMAA